MSDDAQAAATLFPDMQETPDPKPNPLNEDRLSKLYPEMTKQNPPSEARTEPTTDTDSPEVGEGAEAWSTGQQAWIDTLNLTPADETKIEAIFEKMENTTNLTPEKVFYQLEGFARKYGVSEDQLNAFLADTFEAEPEPEGIIPENIDQPVPDAQRQEWREYVQENFDENEIEAAAIAIKQAYGQEVLEKLGTTGWGTDPEFLDKAVGLAVQQGILTYQD